MEGSMIVVFRYLHPDRKVDNSCPMTWLEDSEKGFIPTDVALKAMRRQYGDQYVEVEVYHPHIHDIGYRKVRGEDR